MSTFKYILLLENGTKKNVQLVDNAAYVGNTIAIAISLKNSMMRALKSNGLECFNFLYHNETGSPL